MLLTKHAYFPMARLGFCLTISGIVCSFAERELLTMNAPFEPGNLSISLYLRHLVQFLRNYTLITTSIEALQVKKADRNVSEKRFKLSEIRF